MSFLIMLMLIAGLMIAGAGLVIKLWANDNKGAKSIASMALGAVGIYFVLLVTVSLVTPQKVLGINEEKPLCGFYLDCHRLLSVIEVRTARFIGTQQQQSAQGIYYIVTVRVRNNAKQADMQLTNPVAEIVDEKGKRWPRVLAAEELLERSRSVSLTQPIKAGDYFTKELVFDLPADVKVPALLFYENNWCQRATELFLIGDEDSLFHRRVKFRLDTSESNG